MTNPVNILKSIGDLLLSAWWVWLPIFLFLMFLTAWMYYIQKKWWMSIPWVVLEIKPPKEIEQSPKITEAIFTALWAIMGTVSTKAEKYLKGVMQHYITFEIVGINGQIKFLIRMPAIFRNFVEAKVYAEYPKAEIQQANDYINDLPPGVLDRDWDLWGTVMQLAQPSPYPIKTYPEFVDVLPKQPFIDPIANLMEVMAKLRPGEQVWIQIFIRPAADSWIEEGKGVVAKLIGKSESKKQGAISAEVSGWGDALRAVFEEITTGKAAEISVKKEEKEMPSKMQFLSPGEKDVVTAIGIKMTKKAFEAKINVLYMGKKDVFFKPNVSAVMGFFNQFANLNLNGLKPNPLYTTKAFYLMAAKRLAFKKRIMLRLARLRPYWDKGFILNAEELATLWHFPTIVVGAPSVPVVEAKKGAPPAEIPLA